MKPMSIFMSVKGMGMGRNNFTILIVDDDKNLSLLHSEILAEEGYNVLTAATGEEALDRLEGKSIDLVILDINLPDINGDVLLERIKRIRPGVKVIIMTGHEDVDSYIQTKQKGVVDYLIKPFPPKALKTVLKKILPE